MERTTVPPPWWQGPTGSWEPIAGIHYRLQATRQTAVRRLRRISLLGGGTIGLFSAVPLLGAVFKETCGWPPPDIAVEVLIVVGVGLAVVWLEALIDAWTRMAGDVGDLSELWVHLTRAASQGWIGHPDGSGSEDERLLAADARVAATAQAGGSASVHVTLWGHPRFQVEA